MAQHLDLTSAPRRRRAAAAHDRAHTAGGAALPDGGTTEIVRVIEFLWPAGESSVQPVLWVRRELLN